MNMDTANYGRNLEILERVNDELANVDFVGTKLDDAWEDLWESIDNFVNRLQNAVLSIDQEKLEQWKR